MTLLNATNGTLGNFTPPPIDQVLPVTTSLPYILGVAFAWFFPLFLWFIVGCFARARTADGRVLSKPMIASTNFWYAVIIWGLVGGALDLLLIFPIWLGLFT